MGAKPSSGKKKSKSMLDMPLKAPNNEVRGKTKSSKPYVLSEENIESIFSIQNPFLFLEAIPDFRKRKRMLVFFNFFIHNTFTETNISLKYQFFLNFIRMRRRYHRVDDIYLHFFLL